MKRGHAVVEMAAVDHSPAGGGFFLARFGHSEKVFETGPDQCGSVAPLRRLAVKVAEETLGALIHIYD